MVPRTISYWQAPEMLLSNHQLDHSIQSYVLNALSNHCLVIFRVNDKFYCSSEKLDLPFSRNRHPIAGIFNRKVNRHSSKRNIGLIFHRLVWVMFEWYWVCRNESDEVLRGVYFDQYASNSMKNNQIWKHIDIIFSKTIFYWSKIAAL